MVEIKISKLKPFIFTKSIIIFLGILNVFFDWLYFKYEKSTDINFINYLVVFLWVFVIIFVIGFCLNLFFIKNKRILRILGIIGASLALIGYSAFLISLFLLIEMNREKYPGVTPIFNFGIYIPPIIIILMFIELFWSNRIKKQKKKTPKLEKDVSKTIEKKKKPKISKFKRLAKKVSENIPESTKKLAKENLGEVMGEMGKEISELTGNIGKLGGTIEKKKLTKISKFKGLTKKISENLPESTKKLTKEGLGEVIGEMGKGISELMNNVDGLSGKMKKKKVPKISKLKGLTKKISENLPESVKKLAIDQLEDVMGDVGKGISDLASNINKLSKINNHPEMINIPTKSSPQYEPININLKVRLYGILKAKQEVEIKYIEKILKIPKDEIIGMIYDLIGENKIDGEFNDDDTVFKLKKEI
ncbi:MAG: hypothetical protein ACTSRP_01520 [Candidatus Helarchaeota archaeon]